MNGARLKYFLLGFGAAMVLLPAVFWAAYSADARARGGAGPAQELSEGEIRARAARLGMVALSDMPRSGAPESARELSGAEMETRTAETALASARARLKTPFAVFPAGFAGANEPRSPDDAAIDKLRGGSAVTETAPASFRARLKTPFAVFPAGFADAKEPRNPDDSAVDGAAINKIRGGSAAAETAPASFRAHLKTPFAVFSAGFADAKERRNPDNSAIDKVRGGSAAAETALASFRARLKTPFAVFPAGLADAKEPRNPEDAVVDKVRGDSAAASGGAEEPAAERPRPHSATEAYALDLGGFGEICVTEGMSSHAIAKLLAKAGIVKDAADFNRYVAAQNRSYSLKYGKYVIEKGLSPMRILAKLTHETYVSQENTSK